MQVIILGMHRSGTSVVGRLLNMMGCYYAPEGAENAASPDNPKGYWERKDVIELNTWVLRELGCDWDSVSDLNLSTLKIDKLKKFRSSAGRILLSMEGHRPWFLKDPRLCLLFPLWRELLELPVCLIATRHPLEVADSLSTRNGFSIPFGLALWEKYVLSALEHSLSVPRLHISFQEIMQEPVSAVSQLRDQLLSLGVEPLRQPSEREIVSFIDPGLYRQRVETTVDTSHLDQSQAELCAILNSGDNLNLKSPPQLSLDAEIELRKHDLNRTLEQTVETSRPAGKTEIGESQDEKIRALVATIGGAFDHFKQTLVSEREASQALRGKIDMLEAELKAAQTEASQALDHETVLEAELKAAQTEASQALRRKIDLEAELKAAKTEASQALRRNIDLEAELKAANLRKSRSDLFVASMAGQLIAGSTSRPVSEGYARFLEWRTTHAAKIRLKAAALPKPVERLERQSREQLEKARALQSAVERRNREIAILQHRLKEQQTRWQNDRAKFAKWADRVMDNLGRVLNSRRWRLGCWLSLKRSGAYSKEAQRFAQLRAKRPLPYKP